MGSFGGTRDDVCDDCEGAMSCDAPGNQSIDDTGNCGVDANGHVFYDTVMWECVNPSGGGV